MKKLLAMILCVMMFVSVLSTSAFAATLDLDVDDPLLSASTYAEHIKDMIKNSKKDIEKAYKVLTADQVVYGTVKGMDDTIVDLVDAIGDTLIKDNVLTKAGVDTVKDNVRAYIDGAVAAKIAKDYHKALDSDGKRDPILYAQLIADSINSALTDKDFQKGYESVATYWALVKLAKDINDELDDQYDDFFSSVDSEFAAKFAGRYSKLAAKYIDTVASAAVKRAANSAVWYDYNWGTGNMMGEEFTLTSGIANEEATRQTAIDTAKSDRTTAYDTAKQTYDASSKTAADKLQYEQDIAKADADYTQAVAQANNDYTTNVKNLQDAYDQAAESAESILDNLQTLNPWGEEVYAAYPRY